MNWTTKFGTIISQSVNALLLGGHPDESLSARAYHERHTSRFWGFIYHAANWIFGANHCYDAAASDKSFAEDVLKRWQ